jgi:hypothetical protein
MYALKAMTIDFMNRTGDVDTGKVTTGHRRCGGKHHCRRLDT